MPQQTATSLSKIQDLEAQLTDLTHQLIVEFKNLEIEELRKQAQLRGVLNVQLMDRSELVTAIFERIVGLDSDRDRFYTFSVSIRPNQQPRQGVNSCGANDIFIFDTNEGPLPKQFLFPLLSKENWKGDNTPSRWVLLPYDKTTGRPLSWSQIQEYPSLAEYLLSKKSFLSKRKGNMIRHSIEKGIWWAASGVGTYSFSPFKVAWQASGKSDFKPIVVGSHSGLPWQGNQSMHAFIPCWSEADAMRIQSALDSPLVTDLLKQLSGEGKCSWAQPGKVKKLLQESLF